MSLGCATSDRSRAVATTQRFHTHPSAPELNRGMWRLLEESVRTWVLKFGQIHIISESVFLGQTRWLPSQRVGVPRQFYKILVRRDDSGNLDARAFLLINWKRLPLSPETQDLGGRRVSAREADRFLRDYLHSIGSIGASDRAGVLYVPDYGAAVRSGATSSLCSMAERKD
jgi:hypothetical protein